MPGRHPASVHYTLKQEVSHQTIQPPHTKTATFFLPPNPIQGQSACLCTPIFEQLASQFHDCCLEGK